MKHIMILINVFFLLVVRLQMVILVIHDSELAWYLKLNMHGASPLLILMLRLPHFTSSWKVFKLLLNPFPSS